MIYIKEGDFYFKYYTDNGGKLICAAKDKSETVILYDISKEFDAVITKDNTVHFVLQGLNGELLYLKKEKDTWKKYSIFKSRNGAQKISDIRLTICDNTLCAFYIISHLGKNLLVKHMFSIDDMFKEPEILGVCAKNRSFVLCTDKDGHATIVFKDENTKIRKLEFAQDFSILKDEPLMLDAEALFLNAICVKGELFCVYTLPRKNSTALVFCKESNLTEPKMITFGIARNCTPHIIADSKTVAVEWEENGAIMEVCSSDNGKTFSKPRSLGNQCHFAKIRQINTDDPECNECAVYNMIPHTSRLKTKIKKGADKSLNKTEFFKSPTNTNITNEQILNCLNEVKADVEKMGRSLNSMCVFLDDLKSFKLQATRPSFKMHSTDITLANADVGEINEENMRLFESTDIDNVLPESTTHKED